MTISATKNCVSKLLAQGVKLADISIKEPMILLDAVEFSSVQVDLTHQGETSSSASKQCFEEFLTAINVTETELETILTGTTATITMADIIDSVVRAVNLMQFHEAQCPMLKLKEQLQAKNVTIDVFKQNPMFFELFKQKLYQEFQGALLWYSPLLQYVNTCDFEWQVMWLWEFLINTPTDDKTYEWLQMLINV